MEKLLVNNDFVNISDYQLRISNRGYLYGDGFFETMVFHDSEIEHWSDHLERLTKAADAYRITLPNHVKEESFKSKLIELARYNHNGQKSAIKIIITRQEGGLYVPENNSANVLVTTRKYRQLAKSKEQAGIFRDIKLTHSRISRFKNLSADAYVQAGIYLKEQNLDEVILLGAHGVIAESLYSNIYWVIDNEIYTPSLDSGCVEGISRKNLIKKLNNNNIPFYEGLYKAEDLFRAESVFTTNVAGYSALMNIEENSFSPLSETIIELLES